jgi:hypothetical protein
MEAIIHILSGLIMHANPLGMNVRLSYDQFIGLAQMGLILILVGLAMIGLARAGIPQRQASVIACAAVLLSVAYLVAHGGNPLGFAEKACVVAGGIFRFIGGAGVAIGVACLLGMGRHSWRASRADLFNPVVIAASVIYGVFCFGGDGGARMMGTGRQIWMALSIIASWISFGGLFGILRSRLNCQGGERQLAVVAGGVLILVLMSFVASPGYAFSALAYSGYFPAGIMIGFLCKVAM